MTRVSDRHTAAAPPDRPATRAAVGRQLGSFATASVAISLPWPLLLVLAWDQFGAGPHGPLALGAIGAARMLPYVLLSWLVGSLGVRFRRDRLLLASLLLRLACLAGLAVAVVADQLVAAVVAATLAVACGTPAYPAAAAAMPQLAGPTRRRAATEALVTLEVAAWVVGPAVGGLLLAVGAGPAVPLVAVGLTAVAVVLARGTALPGPATDRPARTAVADMLRTVGATPAALHALGLGGLVNVVVAATSVLLLPLAQDVWQQGEQGFGIATAWFGFGALAAPLLWRVRGSARARGTWGLVALGVAVAWVALVPSPMSALPVLGLAGAMAVAIECAITEMIQDGVADEHRAGALGLADAVMVCCAMAGALLGPLLAGAVGSKLALLLPGLACMIALVVGRGRPRRRRTAPRTAPAPRVPSPRQAPSDHCRDSSTSVPTAPSLSGLRTRNSRVTTPSSTSIVPTPSR